MHIQQNMKQYITQTQNTEKTDNNKNRIKTTKNNEQPYQQETNQADAVRTLGVRADDSRNRKLDIQPTRGMTETQIQERTYSNKEPHKAKDSWGHQLQPKQPGTIRIILQNIGGIDMKDSGSIKLAALRDFNKEAQADICAITECNVDWKQAPLHLHPKEQMRYWWESSHWSISHNILETNNAAYQPGGTAVVIMNHLSHRAQ